jgi:hypothetical protein
MLSFAERFRFIRSAVRLVLRMDEPGDPWQCVELDGPPQRLGAGSVNDFPWYFEGESTVPAASFEDVCSFLLGCTYMRDPDLFRVGDFWQHPITFEHLRKGDCEDHALWAWRKLRELGYRAHLVAGSSNRDDVDPGGHVWVIFHADGGLYLLEATAKTRDRMVIPLDALRHHYQPHFSVDETFTMFLYGGFGQHVLNRRSAKRNPPPPEPA